ncbi:MAG: glutamate racemase [Corallococcus sp.]|nr:glutamate racemase [Corallococcus sp.]MCM1359422.1 glutamate racemase [Corallococcus sp.]MCM1394865.1 glutamate racemase [Corallococcus sp.]
MQNFVGVMDSGVGGLTVMDKLVRFAPQCNFVYVADHAFCPYGIKPLEVIRLRALAVARFFASSGAQSIVIACNTASVFAKDVADETGLSVFDVITGTCDAATEVSVNRRVALLATDATVKSQVYQRMLSDFEIETFAYPCSCFVPLVERCAPPNVVSRTVAERLALLTRDNCDTVILGCTHFPILRDQIAYYSGDARIISSAEPVAKLFAESAPAVGQGARIYLTSGDPVSANRAALPFGNVRFRHIDI